MASERNSEFITTFDLVPPSPQRLQQAQLQPQSFNGSFHNSPYSNYSELVPEDTNFDVSLDFGNYYEPSEYDAQDGTQYTMFNPTTADFLTTYDPRSPPDYPSPSSAHSDGGRGSPALSVGSAGEPSPRLAYDMSTRPPEVTIGLGNMSLNTPTWGTQPLPGTGSPHSPHPSRPAGIPRVVMSEDVLGDLPHLNVPTIHAPDSLDSLGLNVQVEPATPIGGPGGIPSALFSGMDCAHTPRSHLIVRY